MLASKARSYVCSVLFCLTIAPMALLPGKVIRTVFCVPEAHYISLVKTARFWIWTSYLLLSLQRASRPAEVKEEPKAAAQKGQTQEPIDLTLDSDDGMAEPSRPWQVGGPNWQSMPQN